MKHKLLIVSSLIIFVLIVGVPFIINELYIIDKGYLTLWGASEVLSYYGTILSVLGTIVLGAIAVYQTKKANNISERLLQLEENRHRPQIDIRLITKETLRNYKSEEILKSTLPDIYVDITNYMCELSNESDNFWFELKNLRETDILNIRPILISIKIFDTDKKEIYSKQEGLNTSVNANILNGQSSIPFFLGLDKIWTKVYQESDRTLGLEIVFILMNYDGIEYEQTISLELVNASNGNSLTPAFINKNVSKSKILN